MLFGTGDVIAQQLIEGRGSQHDVSNMTILSCIARSNVVIQLTRTTRMTVYGGPLYNCIPKYSEQVCIQASSLDHR